MGLTAAQMSQLAEDAGVMSANDCRGYLSEAVQCLRDTGDPLAALELLIALWGTGHARRANQKAALDDTGWWLEQRLQREPGIDADRLAFEIGWLRRLLIIRRVKSDSGQPDEGRSRRGPTFGAHLEQLRQRRKRALEGGAVEVVWDRPAKAEHKAAPEVRVVPDHLPAVFEVSFLDFKTALAAFKKARERRKEDKQPKPRFLPIRPVSAELQPLAANIECSMLDTEGMKALEDRTIADAGKVPSFWIAVADLEERDGKRVARRIALTAP